MSESVEHPVQADPATLAALQEKADQFGTHELTAYAGSIGVRPPDDRPDWCIVREYTRDFTFRGLFWVGPDDE
jgi:hypothetical protein